MQSKILVVYTVILGDYDVLREPGQENSHVDFVCFTDNPDNVCKGWNVLPIPDDIVNESSNFLVSRRLKLYPHIYLPGYECSLYIDGNIEVIGCITSLYHNHLEKSLVSVAKHPKRECTYEEAEECAARAYENLFRLTRQMCEYKSNGLSVSEGLGELNIIYRRHDCFALQSAMQYWWNEISNKCKRDQLSFVYSLKVKNVHVNYLDRKKIVNKYFRKHPHLKLKRQEKLSRNFPKAYKVMYILRKKSYRLAFVFLKRVF